MRIVQVADFSALRGPSPALQQAGAGYIRAGHEFVMIVPGERAMTESTAYGTVVSVPPIPFGRAGRAALPADFGIRKVLDSLAVDRLEVADQALLSRLGAWASKRSVQAVALWNAAPGSAPSRPQARALGQFAAIVCRSRGAAAQVNSAGHSNAVYVPNGVDLEVFSPLRWSPGVRRRHLGVGEVLLVHVGEFSPGASPERAIDALRELLGRGIAARLVMTGDGILEDRVERSAGNLPIDFTGFIEDRRELAELLASSDVMIDINPRGASGLSALEALASGTPVVAVAGSATAELVESAAVEIAGPTISGAADAIERVLARRVDDRRADAREAAAGHPWAASVSAMLAAHGIPPATPLHSGASEEGAAPSHV